MCYAMAGESPEHRDICSNLVAYLSTVTRHSLSRLDKGYESPRSAQNPGPPSYERALFVSRSGVVCGAPQFHDAYRDVLLNPTVIIECYRLPPKPLIVERNSGVTARGTCTDQLSLSLPKRCH